MADSNEIRDVVRNYYARTADSHWGEDSEELIGPALGCGSPLERIDLRPGQDVLDLGCGAGREVIEAARRVAPAGIAYGLDVTEEMLALALENRRRSGTYNAVFLRGPMEDIPLPAGSVDVVISNCVINLSSNKRAVMREMYRVLRPGGRLAISDTVSDREVPASAKQDTELWCACLSGALQPEEYRRLLQEAGFVDVKVDVGGWDDGLEAGRGFRVGSAFISARRSEDSGRATRYVSRPALASERDLDEVIELLKKAGLPTEDIDAKSVGNFIVLRNVDGALVGVAGVEFYGHQALLRSVCVSPEHRGRGLGSRLVAAGLRMARARGCIEVFLLTTSAERFFENKGFRRVDRSQVTGPVTRSAEFQRICPAGATVMRLNLRTCCCGG